MKNLLIIVLILLISIVGVFCGVINNLFPKEYDPHELYPKQEIIYTKETAMKILECFDNKDADTLIDMFSTSVKTGKGYNLRKQIEQAFEIYGGESVSNGGFHSRGYGSSASRDGIYIQKNVVADVLNIKTNNNEVFIISFTKCVLDDDNSKELGLVTVHLRDKDSKHLAIIGRA